MNLWDIGEPSSPRLLGTVTAPGELPTGEEANLGMWFSPDGHSLAVPDNALGTITVFDVASRQPRWTRKLGGAFYELAFTPDNSNLGVVDSFGGQTAVRFFDTQRGDEGRPLTVPQIVGVAYARGGSIIVTTGSLPDGHGGAQLWDAATLAPIGEPLENGSNGATFDDPSPDGDFVMAGTDHGRFTIWSVDVGAWEAAACNLAGRNLTQAEWRQYLPDQPYLSTCPQWPAGQ